MEMTAVAEAPPLATNRAFRTFFLGQLGSNVGDALARVALPLMVLELTGSVLKMGVVTALAGGGSLAAGLGAGVLSDRVNRRRLLLVCDLAQAVLYAVLPVAAWMHRGSLPLLCVVSTLGAMFGTAFRIASSPYLAALVPREQLTAATGRMVASFGFAFLIGPPLMGVLSAPVGLWKVMGLNALSFLVSAASLLRLRGEDRPPPPGVARAAPWVELTEGLQYIRRFPVLRALWVLVAAQTLVVAGGHDLFIFHVRHDLQLGDSGVGWVFAVASAGSIAGGLSAHWLRRHFGFGGTVLGAMVLQGLAGGWVGRAGTLPGCALLALAFAAGGALVGVCSNALRQELAPEHLRGRVNATYWTAFAALAPMSALGATALASWLGAPRALFSMGVAAVLVAAVGMLTPVRARRPEDQRAPAPPSGGPPEPPPAFRFSRGTAVTLGVLAALLALTALRYQPPAPLSAGAPADRFSAQRAASRLETLLEDGAPHALGTAADARVRTSIVAQLEALGYTPRVEEEESCGSFRVCGRVRNVVAELPGESPEAVLVLAHYDSQPAAPGAADDGSGVVIALELARVLKARPRLHNSVLFVLDEGEEAGLVGADAFVTQSAWRARVRAVVNLEARGTSGPSLMFETSPHNAALLALYARTVARPAANSLFQTVYRMLPNETDFTVLAQAGTPGLNFAFIGDEPHYHTPLDDLAHLDRGSLQQQGDNALAMAGALAGAELGKLGGPDQVFFDVLCFFTAHAPQQWMLPASVGALLLLVLGGWRARRRGELRLSEVGRGFAQLWLGLLLAAGLSASAFFALRLGGGIPYPWVAHPAPLALGFALLPWGALALGAKVLPRRGGGPGAWWGAWLGWALLGIAAARLLPGLSYPLVLPTLAAGVVALLPARAGAIYFKLVPLGLAALLFLPIIWLLYSALGVSGLAVAAFLAALVLTGAYFHDGAPLFALPRLASATLALALLFLVVGRALPVFSRESPRKLSLIYALDASSGKAQWLATRGAGPLPRELRDLAAFEPAPHRPFAWSPAAYYAATAAVSGLLPPRLEVLEDVERAGHRHLRLRLVSQRHAAQLGLAVPKSRVLSLTLNGRGLPAREDRTQQRLRTTTESMSLTWATVEDRPVTAELELSDAKEVELSAWDVTPGLPGVGAALGAARDRVGVPAHFGDSTQVSIRERLPPAPAR